MDCKWDLREKGQWGLSLSAAVLWGKVWEIQPGSKGRKQEDQAGEVLGPSEYSQFWCVDGE